MTYIAKVTSRNMVTIPAKIARKYGIKRGTRIKFIESETGIVMIPIPDFRELRGIDKKYSSLLIEAIKELEMERRREAVE